MIGKVRFPIIALIINWNGSDDTLELISSLVGEIDEDVGVEVVVVDNASAPEDLRRLHEGLDHLQQLLPIMVIENDTNIGVPSAYNQAIASVSDKDRYFLRLDNDVVFLKGGLKKLCLTLEQQKTQRVRLVGGNIRYYDEQDANNGGAVSIDLIKGKTRSDYPAEDTVCDGVLGCVMLIDPEVIKILGPEVFLSWLFVNTDESELSMRAAFHGWSTYYVAAPIALHKSGRSTSKVKTLSGQYSLRNWSYLSLRYVRPRILIPLVLARLLITIIYKACKGDTFVVVPMLRGIGASIRDRRTGALQEKVR